MSKTRNLSDLLDANGDVKSTALDNVPASNDASALTTGTLPDARLSTNVTQNSSTQTLTNKTINASSNTLSNIPNSALTNSSITINGSATSLGGSATINTDLVNDTTPQLGGDLDTNGHNINLVDADTINIGSSNDLQIKHTGTNSLIADTGTGNLIVRANDLRLQSYALENTYINASEGGSVDLYHNNSKKLETTSSGATVTGTLTADGISLGDNETINVGASNDLQIYHDGSASFIKDNGAGSLTLLGGNFRVNNVANTQQMISANDGGQAELYYAGSKKFETTSTGATVTGNLNVTGSISGAGKVGQVIQTVKGNVSSTSSGTYSQISGLTATITPASASSKVLVKIAMQIGQSNSTTATFKAYRGSTIIGIGDADGSRQRVSTRVSPDNIHWMFPVYYEYLDSPSTSSAVTYSMYWSSGDFTYINRTHSNGNDTSRDQAKPISTITLMEILP